MKIAINGFGRIGRTFLRTLIQDKRAKEKINVVAINIGPGDTTQIAQLFKYDSIMREFPGTVTYHNGKLHINDYKIKIIQELDPIKINWNKLNIDWVVDATGAFRSKEKAELHIKAGAKKVLITAPAKDEDITIIPGINSSKYDPVKDNIVSLGSCTTNCFAPMIKVLKENFELESGMMTTIHSYTNDQVLLDVEHKDPRRARAAALNIIPTATGADKVIVKIYPDLKGKLSGISVRVPTPLVSLVDFTFTTKEILSVEEINNAFKEQADKELSGILEYCDKPLVSSDFIGNSHSCIFDSLISKSTGKISQIFGWYDNEFGYCCRIKDFLLHI